MDKLVFKDGQWQIIDKDNPNGLIIPSEVAFSAGLDMYEVGPDGEIYTKSSTEGYDITKLPMEALVDYIQNLMAEYRPEPSTSFQGAQGPQTGTAAKMFTGQADEEADRALEYGGYVIQKNVSTSFAYGAQDKGDIPILSGYDSDGLPLFNIIRPGFLPFKYELDDKRYTIFPNGRAEEDESGQDATLQLVQAIPAKGLEGLPPVYALTIGGQFVDIYNEVPEEKVATSEEVIMGGRKYRLITQTDGDIEYYPIEERIDHPDDKPIEVGGYWWIRGGKGELTPTSQRVSPVKQEVQWITDPDNPDKRWMQWGNAAPQLIDTSAEPQLTYDQLLGRAIEEAAETGNWNKAISLRDFKDSPSKMDILDAALKFAESPAEASLISAIARGESPLAPLAQGDTRALPKPDFLVDAYNQFRESIWQPPGPIQQQEQLAQTMGFNSAAELQAASRDRSQGRGSMPGGFTTGAGGNLMQFDAQGVPVPVPNNDITQAPFGVGKTGLFSAMDFNQLGPNSLTDPNWTPPTRNYQNYAGMAARPLASQFMGVKPAGDPFYPAHLLSERYNTQYNLPADINANAALQAASRDRSRGQGIDFFPQESVGSSFDPAFAARLPSAYNPPGRDPYETEPVHLAAGGIVTRPTNAILGENGPEAVIPLTNQSIFSQAGLTPPIAGSAFRQLEAGRPLQQPGSLFRSVGMPIPSAQAYQRLLPSERDLFFQQGRLRSLSNPDMMAELDRTLPGPAASSLFARTTPARSRAVV
jgi:hypothetical protein